jgi:hypothetical protein
MAKKKELPSFLATFCNISAEFSPVSFRNLPDNFLVTIKIFALSD